MHTIIAITTKSIWSQTLKDGKYTHSTIHSTLQDVGFIHCTKPSQTMEVIPRFKDVENVILLLINVDKVTAPVVFEEAKSGRAGKFPHIYGTLNTDAVYEVIPLKRDQNNDFVTPSILKNLITGV